MYQVPAGSQVLEYMYLLRFMTLRTPHICEVLEYFKKYEFTTILFGYPDTRLDLRILVSKFRQQLHAGGSPTS